eukprot:gnl/MRDRNA2_/MRDRNA2_97612_c0_seq1.p1 gnl/MRDRNA2_/MRDRNA2_97612_c0~~gnl/MRDRNA2_/MRDRNA2_97612_c0_seq1.p1  ORF type:complete len:382 (+),score=89.36 gnl/MRDRNA2_/MRDRNA2_97612_c0_seq1:60-1205(+)
MADIGLPSGSTQVSAPIVAGRPVQPYFPFREAYPLEPADVRTETPDVFKGPFRGARLDTWDEYHNKKGFIQPIDEPHDLDDALAEASSGIQRLRLESDLLSEKLLQRQTEVDQLDGAPVPPPVPAAKEFDTEKWQAQLRSIPTETIDSLPRRGRIALLEAGVQAAAAEEGNVLCPKAARHNVPMREDAIVLAASKQGLLERSGPSNTAAMENVTGLAMGSGLGAASAKLAEERSLAEQRECEPSKEFRRRPWAGTAARSAVSAETDVLANKTATLDSLDDEAWIEQRRARRRARGEMRKEEREMHWPSHPYVRADVTWPPFKKYHDKIIVPAPQTEIIDAPLPAFLSGSSRLCRLAKQGHWGSLLCKPTERLTAADKREVQ